MSAGWKIFIGLNIIETVLITVFLGAGLLVSPIHLRRAEDYYFLGSMLGISAVIIFNCISNIFLALRFRTGRKAAKGGTSLFWIHTLLFFGILLLFIWLLNDLINRYNTHSFRRDKNALLGVYVISAFTLSGFMILVLQLILYFKVRKKIRREQDHVIGDIGFPGN